MSSDFRSPGKMRVFLCHSSSDKDDVRKLYHQLLSEGIDPWLDEEKLFGGEDWELEIRKAVRSSHIVIVCLSHASVTKRGFVQKEIKFALDIADEQPEGQIFLIPVKLEQCEIPERLRRWHWIDLFERHGYARLMKAIKRSADSLGISIDYHQVPHSLYEKRRIQAWDWSTVDTRRGPQGAAREANSIQFRVIRELEKGEYEIIFDDHGSGEAADVVTICITETSDRAKIVEVEFYYCKGSKGKPGVRMADLYEVCGQVQKSVRWTRKREPHVELFHHLLRREPRREMGRHFSRFERGNYDELSKIIEKCSSWPVQFRFFIVQPGLSRRYASDEQLELLGTTENRLWDACRSPLEVIASP